MLTAMPDVLAPDSKYRGRRKGIPVREGSVLQARKEAHLTLAQVAGDKVSRTAVHLIEKGRTQPSLETLQQIARQTRKPIEYFLLSPDDSTELSERRRRVRELESLTQVRDFQKVIDLLKQAGIDASIPLGISTPLCHPLGWASNSCRISSSTGFTR